jgi:hypothetical protein
MTDYDTISGVFTPINNISSSVTGVFSDNSIRKGLIIAIVILLIFYMIWTQPWRTFPDHLAYISGFPSWAAAKTYIEDPEASEDIKMKRIALYTLLSTPCGGDKSALMAEAGKIVDQLKKQGCQTAEYLHKWLLSAWNDCYDITKLPEDLRNRFAQFKSYRYRIQPPYIDATMNDLKNMLYVYNSFSPFFVDCSRGTINQMPQELRTYLQSEQTCRSSCGTEPNFNPNVWRRNKFPTLAEAEKYVNDPGISERCRVVRAALLIPLVKVNQFASDLDAKTTVEYALNHPGEVLQSINTVADLEQFVHGVAVSINWNYDIDTIRKLMYTTEFGIPTRANSIQHMFYLASKTTKFSDAPKVETDQSATQFGPNIYRDSRGTPMYLDMYGNPQYANEKDDMGNPVYVDTTGKIHYLTDPSQESTAGRPIYIGTDGEKKFPNTVDANGYPAYVDANGVYNYYDTNAKLMKVNNIKMNGYAYDYSGKVVTSENL